MKKIVFLVLVSGLLISCKGGIKTFAELAGLGVDAASSAKDAADKKEQKEKSLQNLQNAINNQPKQAKSDFYLSAMSPSSVPEYFKSYTEIAVSSEAIDGAKVLDAGKNDTELVLCFDFDTAGSYECTLNFKGDSDISKKDTIDYRVLAVINEPHIFSISFETISSQT